MDIYKKLTHEEEKEVIEDARIKRDTSENEIYLSPEDQYAIDESDIIMTFLNKSKTFKFALKIKINSLLFLSQIIIYPKWGTLMVDDCGLISLR